MSDASPGAEPVGWVAGEVVTAAQVVDFLAVMAGSATGERLGLDAQVVAEVAGTGGPAGRGGRPGPNFTKAEALRTWGAKELLAERLLVGEAARIGVGDIASADEWVRSLESAGELPYVAPSELEVMACYNANLHRLSAGKARRVRHLLVAERRLADLLAARARSSGKEALASLAAEWSLDRGSSGRGGDLGWVSRGVWTGAFEEAVFSAVPGQICGPVESSFGWHVFVVEEVRMARARSFEECRPQILEELVADRRQAALRRWWSRRLAEAVSVPAGAEHPLGPGLPGSVHRH